MNIAKNIYTGIFLLSIALLSGCSKDMDENIPPAEQAIQITPTIYAKEDTRVSGTTFETNDRIGVYIIPYQTDNITSGQFSTDAHSNNIEYVFNGSRWDTAAGSVVTWPGNRKADVYAYYPYNGALTHLSSSEYEFKVRIDQREASALAQSDFLWAKESGLSPTKNVRLSFYHRLSLISINVLSQIDSPTSANGEMEISLVNVNPTATIDMVEGKASPATSGDKEDIYALPLPETENGYNSSYKSIIPPQTIGRGERFIKIRYDGVNYYYQPTENITLESGKKTVFNITLTEQGLNVQVVTINEWQEGGVIEDNVNEKAPWVADLNAIDWSTSNVQGIYHHGVRVALVTKEYLFKNRVIDAPAVVVYPIDTEGQTNLGKGLVAQIMDRKPNAISGDYEINTADIHGGTVSFDITNNTLSGYSPKEDPVISKVEIKKDGTIVPASANAIPLLTTEPVYLTDIDRNNYPIVKIGTQYWTMENYRVEHYRNGDPLIYYYYKDNRDYKPTLGALYTWNTIMDSRGFAPEGWLPPTAPDWQSMHNYLTPDAGRKMKAITMWSNPANGDNVSGFSGLPGGRRTDGGIYNEINLYGQWWSITPSGTTANRLYLASGDNAMHLTLLGKGYTQSVRLLKQTPL